MEIIAINWDYAKQKTVDRHSAITTPAFKTLHNI
jgi:hypothetical protein